MKLDYKACNVIAFFMDAERQTTVSGEQEMDAGTKTLFGACIDLLFYFILYLAWNR